ncbi:MAG: DUF89 family protein [Erysipelotrichaceae bacterium]|nr:DUF89 family protein [Erysipelotrichaceae bacterium]
MKAGEECIACILRREKQNFPNEDYLRELNEMIEHRGAEDSTSHIVYYREKLREKYYGKRKIFEKEKKQYNDFVLAMEDKIRRRIDEADDPLREALLFARTGNYIDFGAMNEVDPDTFLSLLEEKTMSGEDEKTYASFVKQCEEAKTFLLIADNCGEIVLDRIFLEYLKKRCPKLRCRVLVRGEDILNDVTKEDAEYVGMDRVAEIIGNGRPIPGTVIEWLPEEARKVFEESDVILAKGQGNVESLYDTGCHIFYLFLCKCGYFTSKFHVPLYGGIFHEENKTPC